jgi:hypothetical protein
LITSALAVPTILSEAFEPTIRIACADPADAIRIDDASTAITRNAMGLHRRGNCGFMITSRTLTGSDSDAAGVRDHSLVLTDHRNSQGREQ